MPGSEPGSWGHTRHHPSPRIFYSMLHWDSLWRGKPLGKKCQEHCYLSLLCSIFSLCLSWPTSLSHQGPLPGPHCMTQIFFPTPPLGHFPGCKSLQSSDGQLPSPHCGSHWTSGPEDSRTSPHSLHLQKEDWDPDGESTSQGLLVTTKSQEGGMEWILPQISKWTVAVNILIWKLWTPEWWEDKLLLF